jgi:hypothetical protein
MHKSTGKANFNLPEQMARNFRLPECFLFSLELPKSIGPRDKTASKTTMRNAGDRDVGNRQAVRRLDSGKL